MLHILLFAFKKINFRSHSVGEISRGVWGFEFCPQGFTVGRIKNITKIILSKGT